MRTIQELAIEALECFEYRPRVGKEAEPDAPKFWFKKDDAPDWVFEMCREAHNGMFPDDTKYSYIVSALDAISENEDMDDARDNIESDIYNHDLAQWLSSHNDRFDYCDQALDILGPTKTIFDLLSLGQRMEREEVFNIVIQCLENQLLKEDSDTAAHE